MTIQQRLLSFFCTMQVDYSTLSSLSTPYMMASALGGQPGTNMSGSATHLITAGIANIPEPMILPTPNATKAYTA
jgi:hypothetical protein